MDKTIKKAISLARPMLLKSLNEIIEDGVVKEELDTVMDILADLHHMKDLEMDVSDKSEDMDETSDNPKKILNADNETGSTEITTMDYVEDELSGAEQYLKLWQQTENDELKNMARDELRHAEFWFRQARQAKIQQAEMQEAMARHGALSAKLT